MGIKQKSDGYKAIILALMFVVIMGIIGTLWGERWDLIFTSNIYNSFHSLSITKVFDLITNYTIGSVYGLVALMVLAAYKRDRKSVVVLPIFFMFMGLLDMFLKNVFVRARPFDILTGVENLSTSNVWQYSFPSGHSTFAFFIAFFAIKHLKLKKIHQVLLLCLALLVAWSRVYLGVHFFFDTIAGAILGMFFGVLADMMMRRFWKNSK